MRTFETLYGIVKHKTPSTAAIDVYNKMEQESGVDFDLGVEVEVEVELCEYQKSQTKKIHYIANK